MIVGWIGAMAWAWADCPDDVSAQIRKDAERVLRAYKVADSGLVDEAHQDLRRSVACLGIDLDPTLLVDLHEAMAFVEFANQDDDAATRAWRAVRRLDPTRRPEQVRVNHPMWKIYEAATTEPTSSIALPRPPKGGWWVDGRQTTTVPTHRAFVLSALDKGGEPLHTGYYLRPDLDSFEALSPRRRRVGLIAGVGLVSAGAGLLLAGGLQELALPQAPLGQIERRADVANRRYRAGAVIGGVGLVLATIDVVRW